MVLLVDALLTEAVRFRATRVEIKLAPVSREAQEIFAKFSGDQRRVHIDELLACEGKPADEIVMGDLTAEQIMALFDDYSARCSKHLVLKCKFVRKGRFEEQSTLPIELATQVFNRLFVLADIPFWTNGDAKGQIYRSVASGDSQKFAVFNLEYSHDEREIVIRHWPDAKVKRLIDFKSGLQARVSWKKWKGWRPSEKMRETMIDQPAAHCFSTPLPTGRQRAYRPYRTMPPQYRRVKGEPPPAPGFERIMPGYESESGASGCISGMEELDAEKFSQLTPVGRFEYLVLYVAIADGANRISFELRPHSSEAALCLSLPPGYRANESFANLWDESSDAKSAIHPHFEFVIRYFGEFGVHEMTPPPAYLFRPMILTILVKSDLSSWTSRPIKGAITVPRSKHAPPIWIVESNDPRQGLVIRLPEPGEVNEVIGQAVAIPDPSAEPPSYATPRSYMRITRAQDRFTFRNWTILRLVFYGFTGFVYWAIAAAGGAKELIESGPWPVVSVWGAIGLLVQLAGQLESGSEPFEEF